jgi:uroporphyrinogen-III synthase
VGEEKLRDLESRLAIAAVGAITSNALQQFGVTKLLVAEDTTADAVVAALTQHFAVARKASAVGVVHE